MKEKHPIVKAIARLIFFLGRVMLSLRYSVKLKGLEQISKSRPVLFLPNHQAIVDPMILVSFLYPHKNIVPVITSTYYDLPLLKIFFKNWGAVRVSDLEAGSRNINVLRDITSATQNAFVHNRSIVIYPSGQIASQGYEKINNKKSAFEISKDLPDNVQVVGVTISGLWGSMWSKAPTGKSPNFALGIFKGIGYALANLLFFIPRRKVTITFEDITQQSNEKAKTDRKQFNHFLEDFFNRNLTKNPSWVSHFFFLLAQPQSSDSNEDKSSFVHPGTISFPVAIEKGVNKIIAQKLEINIDTINSDASLVNDLGADSLSLVEIISTIEKKFKVETVSEIAGFNQVRDLYLLANGDLQKKKELPRCSFYKETPFCDYLKVKSLDNIPTQFIRRFSSNKHLPFAYDAIMGESTRKSFLLKACVVAEIIKKQCNTERVGIMLPALQSTTLLIIACYLAGKVPVMLNWTVGKRVLEHCVKEAEITKIFTATSFVENIKDKLPESILSKLVMMEKEVAKASLWLKITGAIKSRFPNTLIYTQLNNDTAVILFTSGSENLPKAVPLTHSNIVHDLKSTLELIDFSRNERLLGILPPFHSFGFTVLSILPLITGVRIAYFPDPTDGKGVVRTIKHTSSSILIAAPSFLKIILSYAQPKELESVKYVVSGSEALGKDVIDAFNQMAPQATILEGYGITECAPVLSLNPIQKQKTGSVGKVIKDVTCKIIDLENGKPLPINNKGMICFLGKNIFKGYLNPSIQSPFVDINEQTYYKTGDLGYIDNDGYLFITGRLKRFIKIGGEMISLPSIENILTLQFGSDEEKVLAVEGSDTCSPPQITLFTTKPISLKEANECLKQHNAPAIAKISNIELIESIPLLGTGKVDYKVLKQSIGC